jgi:hypothetical protein
LTLFRGVEIGPKMPKITVSKTDLPEVPCVPHLHMFEGQCLADFPKILTTLPKREK